MTTTFFLRLLFSGGAAFVATAIWADLYYLRDDRKVTFAVFSAGWKVSAVVAFIGLMGTIWTTGGEQ